MRLSIDRSRRATVGLIAAAAGAAWATSRRNAGRDRAEVQRLRLQHERSELFDGMMDALDDERSALSQHLHDGPQQTMTAVRLMTDVVRSAIASGDREHALAVLDRLDVVAAQAADELRRTTARLHPVVMAQRGLVQALGSLAETVQEEYGVRTTFHPPSSAWDADDERDRAIFRIAREAAVNAARHGRAPLDIRLERRPEELQLRVDDRGGTLNGRGRAGMGIRLIRARASRIGATLDIETDPDRRTSVILRVPAG